MSGMLPQTNGTGFKTKTMMKATSPTWLPNLSKTKSVYQYPFDYGRILAGLVSFVLIIVGINKIRKKHWLKSILNMSPKEAVIKLYENIP